jgi:hypothetical protein
MQEAAVYDLLTCAPHEPPDARYTAAEFAVYRRGYEWALVMALKVMTAAGERHKIRIRTRRLEARKVKA